ncbi:quinone oxidoreductase [Alcaligenaceae bacterium A4P071]|nr:quinone oxidoreductase [Alcaligenaceae bacterium A4P071]
MHTAQAIQIAAYGDPDVMHLARVEVPEPAAGEVQIVQHVAGVNYLDTYHRRGVFPLPRLPGVLGVEGAGVVAAVGEGVAGFAIGDRVSYACRPIGGYTTRRNLPAVTVLHLPDDVTFEQAGAATLRGLTAHMVLRRVAPVGPGDTVLIHAAAGGLGLLLCQWARLLGARVIGTVGSPDKAQIATEFGCDHVILYREQSFVDEVRRLTDGRGVDAVFEGLGGQVFHDSLTVLRPFGHLVNLGQVAAGLPSVALGDLGPARSLTISVPGVFAYVHGGADLPAAAAEVFGLIGRGDLRVHVGGTFALRDAARAHEALASRHTVGAVVLSTTDDLRADDR